MSKAAEDLNRQLRVTELKLDPTYQFTEDHRIWSEQTELRAQIRALQARLRELQEQEQPA